MDAKRATSLLAVRASAFFLSNSCDKTRWSLSHGPTLPLSVGLSLLYSSYSASVLLPAAAESRPDRCERVIMQHCREGDERDLETRSADKRTVK